MKAHTNLIANLGVPLRTFESTCWQQFLTTIWTCATADERDLKKLPLSRGKLSS